MTAPTIRLTRLPAPLRAAFPWVVPLATTAVTVAVQRVLLPQPALAPFALSFAGVALAAWLAGRKAGIFATVLSAMAANYLFVAPQLAWSLSRPALTATGIFLASASTVALLAGSLREAIDRAERSAALLRSRLRPETLQLAVQRRRVDA